MTELETLIKKLLCGGRGSAFYRPRAWPVHPPYVVARVFALSEVLFAIALLVEDRKISNKE